MKKITASLAAILMVLAICVPIVAAQDIPTVASVSGVGTPPVIETIFVLDDTGDLTHVVDGTQIMPNPGSGNTEVLTTFMKYVIVSDPNGIADISKVEEYMTKADGVDTSLMTTTEVTDYATAGAILGSALAQDIITQAEYDSAMFKLDPLKNNARMFGIENSLNNHDVPGVITVHFKAIDASGGTTFASEGFDYLSLKAFETDFTQIDYGMILVGNEQYIAGDDVWGAPGPDGTDRSTIKNQGNIEFQLRVQADDMSNGETPEQFIQATALSIELLGVHLYDLTSLQVIEDDPNFAMLQPCTPTQISFDITAPDGTSAGDYTGNVYLEIV
ncbi:MAG: hypothetical protein ACT6FF_03715 [Methanosarcinaceae archaeon]